LGLERYKEFTGNNKRYFCLFASQLKKNKVKQYEQSLKLLRTALDGLQIVPLCGLILVYEISQEVIHIRILWIIEKKVLQLTHFFFFFSN